MHIKDKVNEYKQFTKAMSGADLGLIFKGFEKITAESGNSQGDQGHAPKMWFPAFREENQSL